MPPFNFIKQEVRPNTMPDSKVDATFRKVPKHAIAFELWKIDEDRLEPVARALFGTFYDNCAYIIYAASTVGHYATHETITREQKPNVSLERYIHYWLGSSVGEQNRSNVVHKVQELDSYLGNVAAIYRESQQHESARFLSYFKQGYDILSGALLAAPMQPRLFQLHGRPCLRAIELSSIDWAHFNSDYVMVMSTASVMFVWIGRSSASIERRSALAWVQRQRRAETQLLVPVDDGYEQGMMQEHKQLWNTLLPLGQRNVCQATQRPNSEAGSNKFRIYKCNQRGRLHLDQLDVGVPSKEDLNDSNGIYLLDNYGQSIWLWVGAQVPQAEALLAMGNGRAFVKKKKYANSTLVARMVEGHEPVEFKRLFANWLNVWQENRRGHKPVSTKLGKLDALSLCERPKMAADTQLVDDGSGERELYCISGDQVLQQPANSTVVFTTSSCYVIKYSVVCASKLPADLAAVGVKSIIYQWNGSEANAETISAADTFAMGCFEALGVPGMHVQLYEFDETPHFLQLFEGKLIIRRGLQDTFLLKIYGDASYNGKAVEEQALTSISSKDCYVIRTGHVWVWCGQSSTGDAREMAKSVGELLGESTLMLEGKETKEFWQSVTLYFSQSLLSNGNSCSSSTSSRHSCNGSNGSSSSSSSSGTGSLSPTLSNNCYLNTSVPSRPRPPVQLFLVWWQPGGNALCSVEILNFVQQDLSADCSYILDTGSVTYLWLGAQAPTLERQKYTAMAQSYVQNVPYGRRAATALAVVLQHDEPNVFKGFFETWQHDLGKRFQSYDTMRKELATSASSSNLDSALDGAALLLNNSQGDFDGHKKYPLSILVQEIDGLPAEVNPLMRELHLTHDDFVSIFKMSFYEYDVLPKWKKQELKKLYKLF